MDVRQRIERENLATYLADLPSGGHALVVLDGLPRREAFEACMESARDAGERVIGKLRIVCVYGRRAVEAFSRAEAMLVAHAHSSMLLLADEGA